ncbi:hypothetical protein NKJ90_15030 [Mesorhizobium sp. M0051]|uniref:hypothetical protein n=1 Tax=unclassified Mesorhizobium TaxID=325217 RepID=UPI0003CE285D|nr:hypothetical protein [Mesorhizobium sp. LNHC252B00]ESY67365.1 hypothetical protein X743_27200 [Mesorhizobium sp. LNHC252B00]
MDRPCNQVSPFVCDVLRSAFIKLVIEEKIPEDRWRTFAEQLISDFTDSDDIDPELLEWIIRK